MNADDLKLLGDLRRMKEGTAWAWWQGQLDQAVTDALAGLADVQAGPEKRAEHLHEYHLAKRLRGALAEKLAALEAEFQRHTAARQKNA